MRVPPAIPAIPHMPKETAVPAIRLLIMSATILALGWLAVADAAAQPLGTFRWQQQPYCNVITFNVVQQGAIYQLDGFDDQCGGAAARAAAAGIAVVNPSGTIGFGLTIVTAPGGSPVHIDATISLSTLSGTWRDSTGQTGPWTFLTGGTLPGFSPRPAPRASFPAGLSAGNSTIINVAPPVNATDAATRGYVDSVSAVDRAFARALFATTVNISAYSARVNSGAVGDTATGCLRFNASLNTQLVLDLPLPMGAVPSAVGVKYIDTSTSAFTIDVRSYVFTDGGSRQDNTASGFIGSTNGTNGNRLQLLPLTAPAAVSTTQGYYLILSAPTYANGDMAFCGAQVTYTIP